MSTQIQPVQNHSNLPVKPEVLQVIVFGHSALFYWWPLWVVGYVMALLTWMHPNKVTIGTQQEAFHPSQNLGVVYTLLFLLMIVITSTKIRGMAAALVIVSLSFFALLFAYLDWWQRIMDWLGHLSIYLNLGYYLCSSTALCVVWLVTVLVVDHVSFWRFRPGQVTHEYLGGIVDKSYDTDNMVLSKRQDDIFRHWIIGLGSGDLHIQTMGGRGLEMDVANVLMVAGKMADIQRLIATKPDVLEQA